MFVAGTDTGVGKTLVACGLLRAFAAQGYAAVGMKPVASGARVVRGRLRNADVGLLERASNVRARASLVNPYVFAAPIAPHLAAARAGIDIRVHTIERAFRALAARADIVVVEGVGGLLVPLDRDHTTADLARRLDLPILLVVGMRLGCLSHALLTSAAIASRRLELAGWIANRIDPHMRAYRDNVAALERRLGAPLLAEIAHGSRPRLRATEVDRALARGACVRALATGLGLPSRSNHDA